MVTLFWQEDQIWEKHEWDIDDTSQHEILPFTEHDMNTWSGRMKSHGLILLSEPSRSAPKGNALQDSGSYQLRLMTKGGHYLGVQAVWHSLFLFFLRGFFCLFGIFISSSDPSASCFGPFGYCPNVFVVKIKQNAGTVSARVLHFWKVFVTKLKASCSLKECRV